MKDEGLWTDDAVMRSWFAHPARRQTDRPYDWALETPQARTRPHRRLWRGLSWPFRKLVDRIVDGAVETT